MLDRWHRGGGYRHLVVAAHRQAVVPGTAYTDDHEGHVVELDDLSDRRADAAEARVRRGVRQHDDLCGVFDVRWRDWPAGCHSHAGNAEECAIHGVKSDTIE